MEANCFKCKVKREIQNSQVVTLKNGKPATRGSCVVCGTNLFLIGTRPLVINPELVVNLEIVNVLLVTGHQEMHQSVGCTLESNGYVVTSAFSGEEALGSLLSAEPDLILLDNRRPCMDGLAICRRIMQLVHTPIIMVSGFDQQHENPPYREVETDLYISKPLTPMQLLAHVKPMLEVLTHVEPVLRDPTTLSGGMSANHQLT